MNVRHVLGTMLSSEDTKVKSAQRVFKRLTIIITELGAPPPSAACKTAADPTLFLTFQSLTFKDKHTTARLLLTVRLGHIS